MKTKLLLMLCLFCASISNYAQSSASQSGIAVQGIARDANNTAIASQDISLTYTLYYLNSSNNSVEVYKTTNNLKTDAFGVFSDVINPASVSNSLFANNAVYLKIEKGSVVISNEKLYHVPYAISANNGVPTGSIMPFIGTTAPEGWVLCDGAALPSTAVTLIAMVGNNAPDLRGMFLRGAGQNSNAANAAEIAPNTLKGIQPSENKSHKHTGTTDVAGNHDHKYQYFDKYTDGGGFSGGGNWLGLNQSGRTDSTGNHTHAFTTETAGATESRPINYGVNYIIKL